MELAPPPLSPTTPPILVVDDEEVVRDALRFTLLREGYEVVTAPDGAAALRLLHAQRFSLILTDQRMPGLTGMELLAEAQRFQPDTTRVLLTGVVELGVVLDAINKGEIYRFIVKPWLREELLVTVRNGVQRFELVCRNAVLHEATLIANQQLAVANRALESQLVREAEHQRQLKGLNETLEHNLQRSVDLCLKTLQTFQPNLGVQARRTVVLCQAAAKGLKLNDGQTRVLEIAAALHDIGLVAVPRRIISTWQRTPERLTKAELTLAQQHPVLGQEFAGFAHNLAEVGLVIRAHRERYDGRGFPDGLQGEGIPLLARLLSVAAALAETDLPESSALENIQRASGSAFDPEAVRAVLRHHPQRALPRQQREVLLGELAPGMVLARGIYTSNGLLLMPEGQKLSEVYIEKLLNHHRVSPIGQSLVVYG